MLDSTWRLERVVLRPTAVFGPGGLNLVKLARSLTTGSRAVNYLRSSLFGRRRMNLVCIDNVVAALSFVIGQSSPLPDRIYIVSDDDDPANNFRDVESALIDRLRLPHYPLPPIALSLDVLRGVLQATGRASVDPRRNYACDRLRRAGYRPPMTLAEGLSRFAEWFEAQA